MTGASETAWSHQAHLLRGNRREDRRPVVLSELHNVSGRLESEA
jgi:hypothetical protein